ncbi:MAG: glycosyltransferase family 2 protein [Pseudorhodobacter sp.]|nr:glycosyltransferase family 2 protein [Pseudorhodobacter sp.]
MTDRPVSVIVVSRGRPEALMRCLTGLTQQDHANFEVIVVADPASCAVVRAGALVLKLATFDQANIALARNLGLGLASAPVVAFIDDDAVPEPTWLGRLTAPFATPEVVQAGGFVRGRDGISLQWQAVEVDSDGWDHALTVDGSAVSLHPGSAARAVKTQGTNCAFRRDDLLAIGGFDPGFHFYLDEADVNLRLAARGGLTAVVPLAQVHHGFAASSRRSSDRVPHGLTEVGASIACFLRRHGGDKAATARHLADQRARVLRLMQDGRIEPRDVAWLMDSLEAGLAEGAQRPLTAVRPMGATALPLVALPGCGPRAGCVIAGRIWQRRRLAARARAAVAQGKIVTVFCVDPSIRRHQHVFCSEGYWWQRGGLFGQAERCGRWFRWWRFGARVRAECRRIAALRPLDATSGRANLQQR